jgi:hypothetical protein
MNANLNPKPQHWVIYKSAMLRAYDRHNRRSQVNVFKRGKLHNGRKSLPATHPIRE